jgi:DNA-binding helix-hairpin-helix protein with protein kinase domain
MIDCDSYQIKIEDKYFPCPVGSPDLTPVEHHNIDFKNVIHTEKSEAFSFAIIIFECLMLGRHPYDVVGGDDPVTNLKNGNFPYKRGNKGIPKGPWRNIWIHMPTKIKKLFIQTFTEGVNYPEKRVSLENWIEELSIYLEDMRDENYDRNINPLKKLIKITKREKKDIDESESESTYENYID